MMLIKTRSVGIFWLSIILMFAFFIDAEAADPSRNQCNQDLRNGGITEVTELNFGNFLGSNAGKVTVATDGSRTTSGPILVGGGIVSAGVYQLRARQGCDIYPVRVRFRRGNLSGAGPNMRVNRFVSDPVSETFYVDSSGVAQVTIGADLKSAVNQAAGLYTGTYTIRFNFQP